MIIIKHIDYLFEVSKIGKYLEAELTGAQLGDTDLGERLSKAYSFL